MPTQPALNTPLDLSPALSAQVACVSLFGTRSTEDFEALLAQAQAKAAMDVPGLAVEHAAESCRTLICKCTRAVPHGSFL